MFWYIKSAFYETRFPNFITNFAVIVAVNCQMNFYFVLNVTGINFCFIGQFNAAQLMA